MRNKVLFVEGYNEIPKVIEGYLENGWTVYNAPRPLYGHKTWEGDFRHGIFYAAVCPVGDPADEFGDAEHFHERNKSLDGSVCEIVSKETVMEYAEQLAEEYGVNLDDFSYDEMVRSYLGWRQIQEDKS